MIRFIVPPVNYVVNYDHRKTELARKLIDVGLSPQVSNYWVNDVSYPRFLNHIDDIIYLLAHGVGHELLFNVMKSDNYMQRLGSFFAKEHFLLGRHGVLAGNSCVSKTYKRWLARNTTYPDVVASSQAMGNGLYRLKLVDGDWHFDLGQLMSVYTNAIKMLIESGTNYGHIFAPKIPVIFTVIKEKQRYQLFSWRDMRRDILGEGACGVVQKIEDLATGKCLAMKRVVGDAKKLACCNPSIYAEKAILEQVHYHYPDVDGIVPPPKHLFHYLGGAAIIMDRYDGDMMTALYNNEEFLCDPKIMVTACFKLVHALNCLREIGLTHHDIKPANLLYKINDEGVDVDLTDCSLSCSYGELLDGEAGFYYTEGYHHPDDIKALSGLIKNYDTHKDAKELIGKMEVYALGVTFDVICSKINVKPLSALITRMIDANYALRPFLSRIEERMQSILEKI